jgi:cysteine desulfurase
MPEPIYLDYQATTPLDPRVREIVIDAMGLPTNAGSPHAYGRRAAEMLGESRAAVAELVGAQPTEVIFTSGATEANNLALTGLRRGNGPVVSCVTEHPSVLQPLQRLRATGTAVRLVRVDAQGVIDLAELADCLAGTSPRLVTIMAANNEIGTIAPIQEIGALCRAADVPFHCDATQLAGKHPLDMTAAGIDALSLSAHKFYGPQGIGALVIRRPLKRELEPLMAGGGQEDGLRSGTVNVAGAVGMGVASRLAIEDRDVDTPRILSLSRRLLDNLRRLLPGAELLGHPDNRLLGNVNVRFPGIDAEDLLTAAPLIAASTGSACSSAAPEPSHVLLAIGLSSTAARECVRFGVGRYTTPRDVDAAAGHLGEAALRLHGVRA